MQSSGIASLHAGLIERARPKAEPVGIAKLRASQAAPVQVAGPVNLPLVRKEPQKPVAVPVVAQSPRRYGLTLRVDQQMREDLTRYTDYSGRTVQSVLHSALSGYLARANEILNHKE